MRLRLFLGMWAALSLVVAVTVVAHQALDGGGAADQVVGGPGTSVATTSPAHGDAAPGSTVPAPGQVRVEGTLTGLRLTGAVLDPRELPTPLMITSDRGFGNGAEVTGVVVDGRPSTIVWDGGRPFLLAAGAGLRLDPVAVDLVPDGLRVLLGGGAHALLPGAYELDTPVAVGTSGIATPRDRVAFEASEGSLLQARGDAALVLTADAPRRLTGPGDVHLEGELRLTDPAGATEPVPGLDASAVAYDLTLTPGAGGWRVSGIVQQ